MKIYLCCSLALLFSFNFGCKSSIGNPNQTTPPGPTTPPGLEPEKEALKAIYALSHVDDYKNFNKFDTPVDNSWPGVGVTDGFVTRLEFIQEGFTGSIPKEIGNLTKLKYLALLGNALGGTIPTEIGNLKELEYLYLSFNEFKGTIPKEIGNLKELKDLVLDVNRSLTGTIPKEIGNLTKLERLDLSRNDLTGPIPNEIGNLTKLERLDLSGNRLIIDPNFMTTIKASIPGLKEVFVGEQR